MDYLAVRATPGVEAVERGRYVRTLALEGGPERDRARGDVSGGTAPGVIEVEPCEARHAVRVRIRGVAGTQLGDVVQRVRRLFDLAADPGRIAHALTQDAALRPLLRARPGVRIPGCWDRFELCVRAILGQQISVRGATTLAGRLARTFGTPLPPALRGEAGLEVVFPGAPVLARAPLETLGLTRARADAIRALARAVCDQRLRLDEPHELASAIDTLSALPGIGPWTANYVALRGLGEPDAFPAGDLGLRRALAETGARPLSARQLESAAEAWRPWRGYAAMYLWTTPQRPNGGDTR